MDELDRLAAPVRDLLGRVDVLIAAAGAPDHHPLWPALRRMRMLPGDAYAAFAALRPEPLIAAADEVRRLTRGYDQAGLEIADGGWDGAAGNTFAGVRTALATHLDGGPESLVGRMEATAGYAGALADWVQSSRGTLARTCVELLGSAEAVTVCGADPAVADRGVALAAAEIGARVLGALNVAYDGAETLLRQWGPHLAESFYRPPVEMPVDWEATTRVQP
ncbi:hypothetical protein [Melissospora conviva]|uniref:hypothetical protein n=1 Tax=Melissospora conviva TaxID=3388432 RepID=UPI003B770211